MVSRTILMLSALLAASTNAAPAPQGVTALITPDTMAPPMCKANGNRTYGLAISSASAPSAGSCHTKREVITQIPDGQIQANPLVEAAPTVDTNNGAVTQIEDGQIQAGTEVVEAPAAVEYTTSKTETVEVPAPVEYVTSTKSTKTTTHSIGEVTQIEDGQIQAPQAISPAVEVVEAAPAANAAWSSYYYYRKTVEAVPGEVVDVVGPVEVMSSGEVELVDGVVPETLEVIPATPNHDSYLVARQVTQIADGQIQAGAPAPAAPAAPAPVEYKAAEGVTQIADGQIQAGAPGPAAEYKAPAPTPASVEYKPSEGVTQIADGQIQAGAPAPAAPAAPAPVEYKATEGVTQIADGQIQAGAPAPAAEYKAPAPTPASVEYKATEGVTQIADGQIQAGAPAPAAPAAPVEYKTTEGVTQIADGQIQAGAPAPAAPAAPVEYKSTEGVSQIADGQIQAGAEIAPAPLEYHAVATEGVSQIADGQIQAGVPVPSAPAAVEYKTPENEVTQIADGQIQAGLTKRQNGVPLEITLDNGVLKDSQGRVGYIADNRQFQFDGPPQSGAIYTGGWSVCDDGALALGNQKTFWACGSSDFNNLYDEEIFPGNCHPVTISMV